MKKTLQVLIFLTLTAPPAHARDAIPAELFLRYARELIPNFLETQGELYGVDLAVDVDSLVIPKPPEVSIMDPTSPLGSTPSIFEVTYPGAQCHRIDAYLPRQHARAVFFVRAEGQRFKLARTCEPRDARPPRLAVELPGPRFTSFTAERLAAYARPLLTKLVRDQLGPGQIGEVTVKRPWYSPVATVTDYQNIFDFTSPTECRNLTFTPPNARGLARVSVRVDYDESEPPRGVPATYQSVIHDPALLRQFRFTLVEGCGWFAQSRPPRLRPARGNLLP